MTEDFDIATYLYISPSKFVIYTFDKNKITNLYKNELIIENSNLEIDLNILNSFLEKNIFKIEKLIGKFVKNIFLIIESSEINIIEIGIKKKNYQEYINKKNLENILFDIKDVFKENYHNNKIMHMIIKRYVVNDNSYFSFQENLLGDHLCIEVQFRVIPNNLSLEIEKVLEKFQIKIISYVDLIYLKGLFINSNLEISEMAHKVQNDFNQNEVKLVPKNNKKLGFFEKFFQLFS